MQPIVRTLVLCLLLGACAHVPSEEEHRCPNPIGSHTVSCAPPHFDGELSITNGMGELYAYALELYQ